MRKLQAVGAAFLGLSFLVCQQGLALTTAFVDFETNPVLAQQTDLFADAGAEKTIVVPGVASFSGGVVLGDETNLPALSFGTKPNVYGTASASVIAGASATFQSSLTVTIDPTYTVDEVSFPLFNGMQAVESYTVDAFNGGSQIGQQVLSDLATNDDSGHGVIDLKATDITSVTITPSDLSSGWDFSIDSIAFNEAVSAAITPGGVPIPPTTTTSGVPLPAGAWSGAGLLAALGLVAAARSRRKNMVV